MNLIKYAVWTFTEISFHTKESHQNFPFWGYGITNIVSFILSIFFRVLTHYYKFKLICYLVQNF